jgi:N-methylhydantoinase A/oxoprolinase/acetone carboxylase beta subunit
MPHAGRSRRGISAGLSARRARRWDFWIDRGGTFTDVIGRDPRAGCMRASCCRKSRAYRDAAVQASATCSASRRASDPGRRDRRVKMGTTVATNALLERKGERTLLVTTRGFRDALRDRLSGAAAKSSRAHHQARAALRRRRRDRRARAGRRHGREARPISTPRRARALNAGQGATASARRHRLHARLSLSRARAAAVAALRARSASPRSRSATRSRR